MAGEGDQVEEDGEVRLRQKGAERAFGLARAERIPLHGWVAARREGGEGDPLAGEDQPDSLVGRVPAKVLCNHQRAVRDLVVEDEALGDRRAVQPGHVVLTGVVGGAVPLLDGD